MIFRLRPEAENDILSIALYIAAFNPNAALKWQQDILSCCRKLAETPGMGVARDSVRNGLRLLYQQAALFVSSTERVTGRALCEKLRFSRKNDSKPMRS